MSAGVRSAGSPYVGLAPYTEDDAAFFFGRTRECKLIISNLYASRLTLLYGPSGVGKSSVLRAGVARSLRASRQPDGGGRPGLAVVVFSSWRDDPMIALNAAIAREVGEATEVDGGSPILSFVDTLRSWTERIDGQLLVIFDQFEEYFLYQGHIDGEGTFAREFPRAVNREDLDVHFLVSIREDAVARLDGFKGRIPDLFANYLRLEHLRREAARTAIEGPITQYNQLIGNGAPYRIEPELVDAVLDQVRAGQLVVGQAGIGAVKGTDDNPARTQIETSQLQLVMTRLWQEETSAGSHVLRLATLERLGGSARIVQEHLDQAMRALPAAEQDLAASVFHQLVTPSGAKIAHTAKDLAEYAHAKPAVLTPVLERLARSDLRILRSVAPPPDQPDASRFEIFHDVLAPAVLSWRARRVQEQERARRRTIVLCFFMALLLVLSLLGWQWERQMSVARSRQLAAEAMAQLGSDPAVSVRTALAGLQEAETEEAADALRIALAGSHVRVVMQGHADGIQDVAFSPDGSAVATASSDRTARLWDVRTGQQLVALTGHDDEVTAATFSPDGALLVTASTDRTARIWDARTGRELRGLDGHGGGVLAASFSLDGTDVVTAGIDGTARVWDARTGEQTALLEPALSEANTGAIFDARLSPDGTRVVTAGQDGRVRVWDARTGEQLAQLDAHLAQNRVSEAAFSPDGTSVVTAGSDSHAYLWRWQQTSEEPVDLFEPTSDPIVDAEFSPDGRLVVIAAGKLARVYEAGTGSLVAVLRGHADFVSRARFSPDGARIVTASRDGRARLWEASRGALLATLVGHRDAVVDAVFSPDGQVVVTSSLDGTSRAWEPVPGLALLGRDEVLSAAFSHDGAFAVGAGRDGAARVWRVADGREEAALFVEGEPGLLRAAVFSPNGRYVATADVMNRVRVWDWRAHMLVEVSHQNWLLTDVAFDPGGDLVVTAGVDGTARIWEWRTNRPLRLLTGHTAALRAVSFSPDGLLVATASEDGSARVWDVETETLMATLSGHNGAVTDAAFSADGARLVTVGADQTARIWDLRRPDEPPLVLEGHRSPLNGASFDADGRRVVTGASDGTTGVWDAAAGRNLAFLRQHGDSVNSAVFSPDGQRLLTASDDQTARIYVCETCGSLEELRDLAARRLRYVPEQPTGAATPELSSGSLPSTVRVTAYPLS